MLIELSEMLLCPELTEILETRLYQLHVLLKGRGYMIFFKRSVLPERIFRPSTMLFSFCFPFARLLHKSCTNILKRKCLKQHCHILPDTSSVQHISIYVREYRDKQNDKFPLNNQNKGYLCNLGHDSFHFEKIVI